MNTTMQENFILYNQIQVEEEPNQLNQIKSTHGSFNDGYDSKLFENFDMLIELANNNDLKEAKNPTDNLNKVSLQNWFAANSKVQKKNHAIAIGIASMVFLSALGTGFALTGFLGVSVFIAGVIVAALIGVIAVHSFEKRLKENNRASSEISESKNDFFSFFNSQKSNSQNQNDKKIEPKLTPV